jgi:hypothetical protein
MKKISTLLLAFYAITLQSIHAQCPTPGGMIGVPLSLNGSCFINVQFAIPNSNVSIYNAGGFIAQGVANGTGNAVIPYPCGSNPVTSILSILTGPVPQICNTSTITNPVSLPVKLISFSATLSPQKKVMLKWETSLELNNESYAVVRSSDGVHYSSIGVLNSNGNGLGNRIYTLEDISFAPGTSAYYRLKQTDFDGQSSYSKIIYISDKTSAVQNYSLFPNPVRLSATAVQIKGIAASEVTYSNIRIADLTGRTVTYKITGANSIELNPSAPAGIYLVRIRDKTIKLIRE